MSDGKTGARAMRQPLSRAVAALLDDLEGDAAKEAGVFLQGCPVPVFGSPMDSAVATVGLNPSIREFLDADGAELDGKARRFPTLGSLGLRSWAEAGAPHVAEVVAACEEYFHRNPYSGWFRALDGILSGAGVSYYDRTRSACHLDLVPYATAEKWANLQPNQRTLLLDLCRDALASLLRESAIGCLVLNGRTVVENFRRLPGVVLIEQKREAWNLPRKSGGDVPSYAYRGRIREMSGVDLGRETRVLGYNHNMQSSFGVTREVRASIGQWIREEVGADSAEWRRLP